MKGFFGMVSRVFRRTQSPAQKASAVAGRAIEDARAAIQLVDKDKARALCEDMLQALDSRGQI